MSSPSPSGASSSSPGSATFKKQKKQFLAELNTQLYEFVLRLLPTNDELAIKEDVRKLLEKLIRTIEPDSRLMAFGSTANGFSLRNSDMDLCCLIDAAKPPLNASDLVQLVGDLLERETKFAVKTLPHARIPIIKLSLAPSPGLPFGIACDIGFENRLALENTRMLHTYASLDPARVRTMVLFLKVWSKRRKINSPYEGTLSSYGYVLLVIYFLVHVKSPPVLPNIQQIPPPTPRTHEQTHYAGNNIWFFDDIDTLRHRWQSQNTQSVAELCVFSIPRPLSCMAGHRAGRCRSLVDLFRYYSRDFPYNTGVASIRMGPLTKSEKGWTADVSRPSRSYSSRRDGNRLCIEDPFETDFNVGRCVTKEGLYLIRGEFMRASRILAARPESALFAIAQLCSEREDSPEASSPQQVPPAPPYTVGA
ncbi:PAP/OAS1 substrate-binding domain-containing protein, partial [Auricularia subglabra TFB-10046 SS5]